MADGGKPLVRLGDKPTYKYPSAGGYGFGSGSAMVNTSRGCPTHITLDMNLKSTIIICITVIRTGVFIKNGSNYRKSDNLFNESQSQHSGYGAPCMKILRRRSLMIESRKHANSKQKKLANEALKVHSSFIRKNCST